MLSRTETYLGALVAAVAMYCIFEELRKDLINLRTSLSVQSDHISQLKKKVDVLSQQFSSCVERIETLEGRPEEKERGEDKIIQDETEFWNNKVRHTPTRKSAVISGIPPDAVLHPLTSSLTVKSLIIHCIDLYYALPVFFDKNEELRTVDTNTEEPSELNVQNYEVPLTSTPLPRNGHPQYWEILAQVSLVRPLENDDRILEIGICLEECDLRSRSADGSHGYSMTVQFVEKEGIRMMGWVHGSKEFRTFPVSIPNRTGSSTVLHYGVVFDYGRRVAFIDVNDGDKRFVLDIADADETFSSLVRLSDSDNVSSDIQVVAGRDIVMTEKKKEVILKALLDT